MSAHLQPTSRELGPQRASLDGPRRRRRLDRHRRRRSLRRQLAGDRRTGEDLSAQIKEVVAAVAPFVFIAGFLVGVSYLIHAIIQVNTGIQMVGRRRCGARRRSMASGSRWP